MLGQPGFALLVFGQGSGDPLPEGGGVVGLGEVGQLVDDDVVHQGRG